MAATESPLIPLTHPGPAVERRVDDGRVVWLRGKHDISTVAAVWEMLDGFIALDDSDLVVDLSDVQVIDASTIGVIIQARDSLQPRLRALRLQAPSSCARRLLEMYDLAGLIDDGPIDTMAAAPTALGSWVAVPATDPVDHPTSARNASLPDAERTPAG
jgi:anti-anti-sigma factor